MAVPAKKISTGWDVDKIREDFPILKQAMRGQPLAYLDNAATAQKPTAVLEALHDYYTTTNANIHRGVYQLSENATAAYEGVREAVRRHLNAKSHREIVFVRGTTEGVNLVAASFVAPRLKPGDEILISAMEHHSNIVPWQLLCERMGARLRVIPMDERGQLLLDDLEAMFHEKTRFVSVVQVSNSLGTINPVQRLIETAHRHEVPVLIDGAQAVPHMAVDVQALDCDFFVFSGHKAFAPTGIGALYAKESRLEIMQPYQGGGEMIKSVTFAKTVYNDIPHRFEAGTPNIAGVVGLGRALDYIAGIGYDNIARHEAGLLHHAEAALSGIDGLRLIGSADHKASVVSFVLEGVHPHDLGTLLDHEGIAVRTGHHCTQPVMAHFNVPATTRASFAFYNTTNEIDRLRDGILKAVRVLR